MAMLSHHDLIQACKLGDVRETRRLLESFDPGANDNEAIIEAVRAGQTNIVKLLLADPRVDPSAGDNEALRLASQGGHAKIVKLLLADPRAGPCASGIAALSWASYHGHSVVVKLLLADPRVDPSVCVNEAIRLAAQMGHAKVVKLLLADPRVDPIVLDNEPIRHAYLERHTDVIKVLMAHPKVILHIDIVRMTFENSSLSVEFFEAATNPKGLNELMPLANIVDGLSLELLDLLISRAKDIQLNQKFLHSLRLLKLPVSAKIKLTYIRQLSALSSVSSSSDVLKLVEIAGYLAEMGLDVDLFRLIAQYFHDENILYLK